MKLSRLKNLNFMEGSYKIKSDFLTYRIQQAYFAKLYFNFNEIIVKYFIYNLQ